MKSEPLAFITAMNHMASVNDELLFTVADICTSHISNSFYQNINNASHLNCTMSVIACSHAGLLGLLSADDERHRQ